MRASSPTRLAGLYSEVNTMTTKDRVLALLCACRGSYLSGEELAESLNLSRAAVWKAISALRAGGYPIEGQPSRGYRLLPGGDILSLGGIESRLDSREAWKIEVLDQVTSTNALLKARADQGATEGTVLVAASQTLGRGRLGRNFYSPADTGVYLSALLRRDWPPAAARSLTTLAAVAAAQAAGQRQRLRPVLAAHGHPGQKQIHAILAIPQTADGQEGNKHRHCQQNDQPNQALAAGAHGFPGFRVRHNQIHPLV